MTVIQRRYQARAAIIGATARVTGLGTICLLLGCGQGNGVLEIDSGLPRKTGTGPMTYSVHVGEQAALSFRAKLGTLDYAVLHDEAADTYDDCGPLIDGRFTWTHLFEKVSPAGGAIRLTVTGYAQQDKRDAMPVGGRLVEGRPPNDSRDWALALAAILVEVYQSAVEFEVKLPEGTPNWAITRLIIKRTDGRLARVTHAGRSDRGFKVTGPDDAGRYRIRYEPLINEVNHDSLTQAELQVADEQGRITTFATTFPTP